MERERHYTELTQPVEYSVRISSVTTPPFSPSDLWFDTKALRGQPHCDKVSHALK
jgi:hypothetical protein